MEILFRNKRGTAKVCISTECENVQFFSENLCECINEICSLNNYRWEPVSNGYAKRNNLPLVPCQILK